MNDILGPYPGEIEYNPADFKGFAQEETAPVSATPAKTGIAGLVEQVPGKWFGVMTLATILGVYLYRRFAEEED